MRSRITFAAGVLGLLLASSVSASATTSPSESPRTDAPRADDTDLPTDGRPIVATVVAIDADNGMVMLSTAHGPGSLSVGPELVVRLTVGDVVVVRFTDDSDEAPYASPREDGSPAERTRI